MDKELSNYEQWQQEKYGNYIPADEPEDDEEEIEDDQDIELVIDLNKNKKVGRLKKIH